MVLSCYVVCDLSCSMIDHLDELNTGLREFRGALHADRSVAARVRVCVIGFAEVPFVVQPLRPALEPAELLGAAPDGGSAFGAVFTLLRNTIDGRSLVVFISDGRATDPDWPAAFAELTDPSRGTPPEVVAFGVGAADPVTLGRIGRSRAFFGRDGVRLGAALTASVARAVRTGNPRHVHSWSTRPSHAAAEPEKAGEASR